MILVTHEPDIAKRARRRITFRDGEIVEEAIMNPLAACKVAIAALKVNALRSFLAMLGVIIGVASVIVMVSVASGAGQAIEARIRALGTNVLIVSPGSYTSGGRRSGEGTAGERCPETISRRSSARAWRHGNRRHRERLRAARRGNGNWTTRCTA